MTSLPFYPDFQISSEPKEQLINTALQLYSNQFEKLRVAGYKLTKIFNTKIPGKIWCFYQFNNVNNNNYKYLVELYIYSSKLIYCEEKNNPRQLIYGSFDGLIDDVIKNEKNLKISTYQKNNFYYESNISNVIDNISNLKLQELKNKCEELGLKTTGNKNILIYSILSNLLKFEELT